MSNHDPLVDEAPQATEIVPYGTYDVEDDTPYFQARIDGLVVGRADGGPDDGSPGDYIVRVRTPKAPAVGGGEWQWVPKKWTPKMQAAFLHKSNETWDDGYNAMLYVAPSPPPNLHACGVGEEEIAQALYECPQPLSRDTILWARAPRHQRTAFLLAARAILALHNRAATPLP